MIDIHTHILPKMDDGSTSPAETAEMLKLLRQQGVEVVAATPHFYGNRETPEQFLRRREASFRQVAHSGEDLPQILFGAEIAYFAGVGCCEELIPMQLGNSRLLLVEMPFCAWTDRMINEICDIPEMLGLIPVLAHIDRYRNKKQFPKYCQQLKEQGVYFQCNANMFEGALDRRWALKQLQQGYIHFLGSDCHNLTSRAPNLELAAQAISKKLGDDTLAQLNKQAKALLFPDGKL